MQEVLQNIENADWQTIAESLHQHGYALIPKILTEESCERLRAGYDDPHAYRKTVVMGRYRFGLGEYRYFKYPLPDLLQEIRTRLYPKLAPIANTWFRVLKMETRFPLRHAEFLGQCHARGQQKAAVLILKYGKGGFNTLHQDLYGDIYFPMQSVLLLSEPEKDFTGGEFVMTQQIPRAQSKALVIRPEKGDLLIFTTHFRPRKGKRGYYRIKMKHGVSEVKNGERYTLGIIYHDATV